MCVCRYTEHGGLVYASVLFWPEDDVVTLGSVTSTVDTQVTMLGYQGLLQVRHIMYYSVHKSITTLKLEYR